MCGYEDGFFGKDKQSNEVNYVQEYREGSDKREEMVKEMERTE